MIIFHFIEIICIRILVIYIHSCLVVYSFICTCIATIIKNHNNFWSILRQGFYRCMYQIYIILNQVITYFLIYSLSKSFEIITIEVRILIVVFFKIHKVREIQNNYFMLGLFHKIVNIIKHIVNRIAITSFVVSQCKFYYQEINRYFDPGIVSYLHCIWFVNNRSNIKVSNTII